MDFISVNPVYTRFTPIPSLLVVAFCALNIRNVYGHKVCRFLASFLRKNTAFTVKL